MDGEYVYRERQVGWGVWVGLGAALCIGLPLHARLDPGAALGVHVLLLAVAAVLVLALGSLTVEVGGGELRWRYGWLGWPRWRLPLAEIARIEPCRSGALEGWGIRVTSEGMLYNIHGREALRITRRDGLRLRLGSGDVAGLVRALQPRLTP